MAAQENNTQNENQGQEKPDENQHDIESQVDESQANHESEDVESDSELDAAQLEIAKLKDAFLRSKAEQENIRRRAEKDVANGRKFAVEGFAKEMVNVFDSLKLASATDIAEDADDAVKSIHEGVGITLKQLQSAFAKFSLVEISPEVGDKLDPNLHQAMTLVESPDVASGCVLNVIQAGFQLHDRLLRPAMVVVAK
jgi:molecular chaperone GrpE